MNIYRGPSFVGGVADIFQATFSAFWFAGDAQLAPMRNYLMGK
jgi:hypothetical protein